MAKASLLSIPVEIRISIFEYAGVPVAADDWPTHYYLNPDYDDGKTFNSLISTCRAFADELFHVHIPSNGLIDTVAIHVARSKNASDCWLSLYLTSVMSPDDHKFYIRDLEDPNFRTLIQRAAQIEAVHVDIEVPQLAALGRGESEGLTVIWSKVCDAAAIIASLRSVKRIYCQFNHKPATKLDVHRFFSRPVTATHSRLSSLASLVLGKIADPFFINKSVSTARMMPLRPGFEFHSRDFFWTSNGIGYGWGLEDEDSSHKGEFGLKNLRISKTAEKGICRPQSLSKRVLKSLPSGADYDTLTENEVLELRHEMRTLSIAVDAVIDTCRGRAGNMLRLHRFATWDCAEANGMSVAAQQNLLRGAGPQDRTISNRETLMEIMKPEECATSSYPVDTWYDKYPQGIEPLDLLAKRHRECFEEDPKFEVQNIAHLKD
ncbi:hypothetical protein PG996_003337 [Apiospora saccharicola]|uniref:Uncharacterized protein n=1 Tax=Apiospora saccharicola TaxID=335842 RepID=A0ABR1W263_9PEZI